jgi:ABC-type polysaccharide/polyol phosphate transport system ATPase subunit
MTQAAVEVTDVSKTFLLPHQLRTTFKEYFLHPFQRTEYERQQALVDISFAVDEGEFFGIVGANGSGKSTLLKIIAGIYRQDAGDVRVRGILSPFIELGVGFNPELSGRDNVRLNATLLGFSKRELAQRFDEIVAFSGLERFMDQKLKNYSSGMEVRLAYSIAIQVPFDVLLLDEVLAVGDEEFQRKCFETFDRFREERKTIVFVSHDLESVAKYCGRAIWLENGRLGALGPAVEVIERYAPGVLVKASV